jgi:hypothetical protein
MKLGDGVDKAVKRKSTTVEEEVDRVRDEIGALVARDSPVIAGPFTGEVGFELLYWIPMLRWAVEEFPALRGRLVVVSRGGVEGWIEGLDATYVDVLSLLPSEDFAVHRGLADKQREVREFELRAVEAVKRHLGMSEAQMLHPSLMYHAYLRFLKINQLAYSKHLARGDGATVHGLTARYEPIRPPERGALAGVLPDEYVAMRFYSRDSFPRSDESAAFASAVIRAIARVTNVVLVGSPFALDEHRDVQGELPDGVTRVDHLMTPDDNLAVQTAVVANARAFVGTYGGFSYLAPFLNVPSISFSTASRMTQVWHHELAQGIFAGPGWGGFVALQHSDLPLIEFVTRGFDVVDGSIGWGGQPTTLTLTGGVRGAGQD